MDEKGRRFSKEDNVTLDAESTMLEEEFPEEEEEEPIVAKHADKDKRLKDKNSKKLEKLLKKQRKRDSRSNREVLSYEDLPLQEREEDKKPQKPKRKLKKPSKRIVVVSVIVLLLFVIVFMAFNPDRFSLHNISNFVQYGIFNRNSDESFPLDIKGESVNSGNFLRIDQDICYSSDTKTRMLNNYGRSVFSQQHAYINPVLTVGKKGALVYNLGGNGFQLIDKKGNVYNGEAEDNIMTADYSAKNGRYAIVTQSSGYLSKLYVYDEKHEQIFAYSFADYYVTSVCLNSSGSRAVVAGVSALDGVNVSSVYILDFTKDTPLYQKELENNILYEARYLNDKYACAIGRSACCVINTNSGEVEVADYEGRDLTAYDVNTDTSTFTVSLSSSGDGRNCDIISFKNNGTVDKSFSVEEKVIGLSSYKGRVALLTDDAVMLYTKDGSKKSEKELSSDPHSVVLYTSSDAYVLCTGYITALSL